MTADRDDRDALQDSESVSVRAALRALFPWWLYRPTVISIGCSVATGCCVGALDWLLGRLH